MTLEYQVHILENPYKETIPYANFASILDTVVQRRADDIEARFADGEFERNRMSFTLLDPTAPSGADADDIVLAVIMIGPEGDFFGPNAMAKAFAYRDHGYDGGGTVMVENHRVADGSFRFGGTAEVAGTIVGGSGQTPLQDRYQSTLLAADFNYLVAMARAKWEAENGPGRWYATEQAPTARFSKIISRATQS